MDYTDEQIIMMRRQLDGEENRGIHTPNILIGGEVLNFERMELFDGFLSVMLPKEYEDMSTDMARRKYPMEDRPQIIKTSTDTAVNFCFSKYSPRFTPGDVDQATKLYFGAIRRVFPATRFHTRELKEDRGYFTYTLPGVDQDIFQMQAFVSIKEKMAHFIFNTPDVFREGWSGPLLQVLDSIQATDK